MNARLTRRFGVVITALILSGCALPPAADTVSSARPASADVLKTASVTASDAVPAAVTPHTKRSLKASLAALLKSSCARAPDQPGCHAAASVSADATGVPALADDDQDDDSTDMADGGESLSKAGALSSQSTPDISKFHQSGQASWYGSRFHGRRTASGERYDMHELTAAHRSLPLLSYVRVTNTSNNRSVVVKINDRGPFHSKRILDLSFAAATELGMQHDGTERVTITGLSPKEARAAGAMLASR